MDSQTARRPSRLADILAGATAGKLAGLAYLVTAGVDNRISGRRLYDMQLLARPFVRSTSRANKLGFLIHVSNSMALGAVYGLFVEERMPGPPAVKGAVFACIEGTVLYPAMALEGLHPARKADEMGRYWSFRSYLWTMPRHVAYGATLGWLYPRLRNL